MPARPASFWPKCAGVLLAALLLGPAALAAKKPATPAPADAGDRLTFIGRTTFSEADLRAGLTEQLRDIAAQGLTPARADDTAFYVGSFYRKAGFSKVTVDYEIRGSRLVLKINEGPRSLLGKVTFIGNASYPNNTLLDYMVGANPEALAKSPEKFPYTASGVSSGVDRVRGFYLSEGFLNVVVESPGPVFSAGGTRADVTVKIKEGTHYTFGAVAFSGETIFPREELVKALVEPVTGPFSPGTATAMQRNLQSFYKAHGYYQAEVSVEADPAKARAGKVAATFTVRPRGLFRFGGVEVRNETERPRLRADFLPKRFAHLDGEVYDPAKLDETFREMLRTGLFENLRVTPTPFGDHRIRLDLTAKEAKAKELGFTLGFNSYEGATAGFRLGDRNLFGNGRPLTFAADYTQRGIRGELLYVDPWLFDTRFALRARLFSQTREEEGYTHREYGARVDLSRKVLPHLELGVFLEGQSVTITDFTLDPQDLGPLDYTLLTLGLTQSSDYRNDPINPGRGFVVSSSFDFSTIDGEPAFTRSVLRFSYYLPIGKSLLLALGARAGYISPLIDELPIDVRFFNGGGTTVRSFAERELGPKDRQTNPLGGDLYTVFNSELIFPLVGALQGAVFVDAGSLKNDNVDKSGELRYAVGLGLRYKLPIGPLRLDYGVNPTPKGDESFGAFHFSFGFAF